jgi:hypothetical protein
MGGAASKKSSWQLVKEAYRDGRCVELMYSLVGSRTVVAV